MYNMGAIVNNIVTVNLKVAKKVNPQSVHYKKGM